MTENSRFGGGRIYEDLKVPCRDCGDWFVLTASEQRWFEERGLQRPKRCARCREARKRAKEAGGP